jgi:hypothetical protein
VEKFSDHETREMQAQRQTAPRNEDAVNFCKRFLNVHVGESKDGNYAIETLILEWQAFTGASQDKFGLKIAPWHPPDSCR